MLLINFKLNNTLPKGLLALFIAGVLSANAIANSLPILGDYSSSIISLNTEYALGQGVIRQIRGADQSAKDPIVEGYLQDLVWDLVSTSQLSDKRITPTIIGNLSVNAFAVPGGIIGIHAGLILVAKSEAELASVISHELAHLSQRHFAAQLDNQRINTPFAIASLIASILIANSNAEAGSAVLSSTTANQLSSALAFSRRNEQEADRIGMLNLAKAGYEPIAMSKMFSRLLALQRLQGSTPPKFLLTHPSSSERVADSANRAKSIYRGKKNKQTIDFAIIQAILNQQFSLNSELTLQRYRKAVKTHASDSNRFNYALALAKTRRYVESVQTFARLSPKWRQHLFVQLSLAQIHTANQQVQKAHKILRPLNKIYPDNSAVQLIMAHNFIASNQPQKAVNILTKLTEYAPDNAGAWYILAEAHGLAGNRVMLHVARIQYFQLVGQLGSATRQLSFARQERSLTDSQSYILDDLETYLEEIEKYSSIEY